MYKSIYKQSGVYPECKEMDIYLTSLGFTEDTLKYIQNPCPMHSPYLMNDISKASDILWDAIQKNLKVCIIGDYDADGTNSTSTLYLTLQYCDANVDYIIPHRILDGYGLSINLVDKAISKGARVILTCDNGIAAVDAVDYAKSKGLTVIVTDHHEIQENLPKADAIVHPGLGTYPFRDISGCQVAYKLAMVLLDEKKKRDGKKLISAKIKKEEKELREYLFQLSTITIVSDVMPIAQAEGMELNENRKWLIDGLQIIQNNPNWRIKMMLDSLKINHSVVDEQTIGFYIAPVINSAGRLNTASDAVEFLIAKDEKDALYRLSFIMYLNEERKKIKADCMKKISYNEEDNVNIVVLDGIHEGIIGILAGQLANTTKKPAFVFTDCEVEDSGTLVKAWKGSARGNGAVNLFETLSTIQKETSSIYAFGGHADAAGITVLDRNFEVFKEALTDKLDKVDMDVDVSVLNIYSKKQKDNLVEAIKNLKPFGNGMPLPKYKQSHSISSIDLFYKSGHAKLNCWEKDADGKFVSTGYWLFNQLENIVNDKAYMDHVELKSSNYSSLCLDMSPKEAEANKCESYYRPKTEVLKRNFIIELGYTAFANTVGPNYNVIDVYE